DADVLLDQPLAVTANPADLQSPTVDGFSFTPPAIDVTNASARVDVSIDVGDELAGVKAAWLTFRSRINTAISPAFVSRHAGSAYPLASPTLLDGTLTGYVTFPRYDRAGAWTVSQVCAYDWVGHLTCISGAALADLGPTELTVTDNTGLPDDPSWTVNSTGDTTDANGCTTLHCTLREAIARANAEPGPQTIDFDLPAGSQISVGSGLPALTDPGTVIDGGASGCRTVPTVVLDGSSTTGATTGFTLLGATDVTIKGLTIRNFAGPGIFANNSSHRLLVENDTIIDNGNDGVQSQADDVTVSCSRLSGNAGFGVHFGNEAAGGTIAGNVAGLAVDGVTPQENFFSGVFLRGSGALVGGPLESDANVLSGNRLRGIEIHGAGNRVEGNLVGLAVDGVTPAGNGETGIIMQQGGSDTTAVENHVAHNGRDGIVVSGSTSRGNTITRNSVHDNAELGIDLLANANGPDANDPGDADSGPNGAQNMPVLTSTEVTTTATSVEGTLDSTPSTPFIIEVFANPACDPSGHGEGETYLGSFGVTTDAAGLASFDADVAPAVLGSSISVTATDQVNGETSELSACTTAEEPSNRPPTVEAGGPYTVAEGSTVLLSDVVADDPDGDPLTVSWDPAGAVSDPTALQPGVTGVDDGTISLQITVDDGTATASDTTNVVVTNVAPAIVSADGPSEPTALGNSVSIDLLATDPGTADTHTWTVDWGDGTVSSATGLDADAAHTYAQPGVYVVSVTVTDDDGGTDAQTLSGYVVVYDPDGGFVTGGGWINSPAGSYTPGDPSDPDVVGRANFGFVAKYKKGQSTPTGHTEFQFQAGDLNFASSSYDWLVVAGSKAVYKGLGTVNGEGGYRFMLSAIDGGKSGPDRFRIKIVEIDGDIVLYDNQAGAGDDADASTAIQGGSIVIHK
ncbi:MAG: CSLREA domain-containing protein, partial [Ilumatobacter sp.]|nr:CSLREA domain-containing protein [Ilumatobacter sp.]